jgi:hypothetical protein
LSNRARHRSPAGTITRARPTLRISTRRTPGGNATSFGNRTAWLRCVVNTVEEAIGGILYIPTGYP